MNSWIRCLFSLVFTAFSTVHAQIELGIEMEIDGTPRITLRAAPGSYEIQRASALGPATTWGSVTNLVLSAETFVIADDTTAGTTQQFYRAVRKSLPEDPVNPDPQRLVWIKPGTFRLGSPDTELDRNLDEGPQTEVTLTKGFWMGKCEVTQREYAAVMGRNPSTYKGNLDLPVEMVGWNDATGFCTNLTEQAQSAGSLPVGYAYRLPTEAEWEYACRAGTTTRFCYGDDPDYSQLEEYAWYNFFRTDPVGQRQPNAWGLYDMHGNVFEWCLDWQQGYPGGSVTNLQGASAGNLALRGGFYGSSGGQCRSAARWRASKENWASNVGFRVVLAPTP